MARLSTPLIVTRAEVEAARTPAGGWSKATLAAWVGVRWPPAKGRLEGLTTRGRVPDPVHAGDSPPATPRDDRHVLIRQVAQRAGVSTRALRYYEEQGLLEPQRTPSAERAIDARHLDAELSARLLAEHARLESEVASLQSAGRRLAALIGLVDHPDDASCPVSLDEAVGDEGPLARSTSLRPPRRAHVA